MVELDGSLAGVVVKQGLINPDSGEILVTVVVLEDPMPEAEMVPVNQIRPQLLVQPTLAVVAVLAAKVLEVLVSLLSDMQYNN